MKEYTILALFSLLLTYVIEGYVKTGVFKKRIFWLFILVILVFKLLVNGFLTGSEIVLYNPKFYLGLRIGTIPIEDFLFGFSMVSLTIIFWQYFKKENSL